MVKRFSRRAVALALLIALPATALAQHNGGGPRGGGGARSGGAPRASGPIGRAPSQPQSGGFDFDRDINARPAPAPQHPVASQQAPQRPNNPGTANYRPAPAGTGSGGPYRGRFHGSPVRNPHGPGNPWGWNRGVVWVPATVYWGGGFWGPWAFASLAGALAFGAIADADDQLIYQSYQIEPDSPGAQLLDDYGLQQTQCGQPNLVVIWGPDGSVICAFPTDSVIAGNYEVDPSTFTLVPESS
jgi:hypothetical protein